MTYHMEQTKIGTQSMSSSQAVHQSEYLEHPISSPGGLVIDRRITFPERLWEVVNDDYDLVNWGPSGETIIAEGGKFENEVG